MGVYIKGMEMPKKCAECRFFAWKQVVGNHCTVDDKITFHAILHGFDVNFERNGNCPLIEIPSHGRLIDRDALTNRVGSYMPIKWTYEYGSVVSLNDIEHAPTIIPADKEEI